MEGSLEGSLEYSEMKRNGTRSRRGCRVERGFRKKAIGGGYLPYCRTWHSRRDSIPSKYRESIPTR